MQTIAGLEHETGTSSEQNPGPEAPVMSTHTDHQSALPQLLRTCRQIQNEAKSLLYNNNYFQIDFGKQLQMFRPESRREIRHMVLGLDWSYLFYRLPREYGRYIETWAELLGGLSTLHLIVGRNSRWHPPDEWHQVLKRHLEFIDQHIPPHVEVVVDTDGNESSRQLVDETISNDCTFEQLAAGDEIFERGIFAPIYPGFDLDQHSPEDDEFIDDEDP
ncbi:hypothetical protein NW768_002397 [Fusarium equiseti]|uniref:Uncharacterized protein n=1 Tax=Fusarium equiseti TaxID=61235 RepID=A0ABQ8RNJ1_FUSEQ|nr:hypothetical protein NW768_002397 [Fusarium equiseti]